MVENLVFAMISREDLDEMLWIMYQIYMPSNSPPSVRDLVLFVGCIETSIDAQG
jgi:hypothetical protein